MLALMSILTFSISLIVQIRRVEERDGKSEEEEGDKTM